MNHMTPQFILFPYRHQQWHTDEAQVRPGNLVDNEEWEADYYDPKSQLKERVKDCMCGVPMGSKQLHNFSFDILPSP
jgi:hypothetical protein